MFVPVQLAANGFGLTPQQAGAEIVATRALFELLPETAQVYPRWEGLIANHVALMIEHRIPKLLTFNDADYRAFVEIEPLNPFDVLAVPRS